MIGYVDVPLEMAAPGRIQTINLSEAWLTSHQLGHPQGTYFQHEIFNQVINKTACFVTKGKYILYVNNLYSS